ncbi:la protein 1-like isoform X1 [Triticum dicoccoides]|uniref:la protein 1-like isoform X1 n=1 Tax=Triticum dicoccoides TaxID=85692 RepID=UPI00188FA0CA|nr:la protein 1-like isoform X1 [Triticum dicoccoides]
MATTDAAAAPAAPAAAAAPAPAVSLDETKAKNVLRQVEFYFSDSNLPRDGFLRKTVEESEDGLASLALICSFAKMRSHLGLDATVKEDGVPETTVLAVAKVLRCSAALRVSEDGKRVGRANELLKPDEIIVQIDSRSIAVSPLPHNVKLEDVQSFFAQYGKVNSVRLPKHVSDKRQFCGTALVEFSEEDEANNIMNNKLSFAGADLEIKTKKEFDAEMEAKKEAYEKSHPNTHANKNGHDEGYPKGLILSFKLKRILADGDTEQNGGDKVDNSDDAKKEGASDSAEESGKASEEKAPENTDAKEEKSDDAEELKGSDAQSVKKDDKSLSENDKEPVSREDFKEYFAKFGTVRYVDFSKGDISGYLRFEESTAAEKARAFAALADEGGLVMKGHLVTLEPVSGQAEKDYWSGIKGGQGRFNNNNRSNRGGRDWKNNRGGGGRHHGGGKRGGRHSDNHERANKVQKLDSSP